MNKEDVLSAITALAEQHQINKSEIISAYEKAVKTDGESPERKRASIADILYYIGGAIVFMGIGIFLFQNWNELSSFTRIISTLGSGVAAFIAAVFLYNNKKTEGVGMAFHLITALLLPIGLSVTFHEAGFDVGTREFQSLISVILLFTYLSSLAVYKKDLFIIFSVIFGTWFYFAFTDLIVSGSVLMIKDFFEYRVLAAGLAYVLLGKYFSDIKRKKLQGFLYGFGILGILGSTLALGGWKPNQNIFWELISFADKAEAFASGLIFSSAKIFLLKELPIP